MIRLLCRCAVVAILVATAPIEYANAAALEFIEKIAITQRFKIHSEILGEDRRVLINLPESYGDDSSQGQRYPTIYLLDGAAYFDATNGVVHHLSANSAAVERIPESILVAVQNVRTKRPRDMTPSHMVSGPYSEGSGGAASFRAFLEKELLPQVDARFRTTNSKILVGHSLAGLFVLDTFVERPELFDAYIAIDPSLWWDDAMMVRKLASHKASEAYSRAKVFIAESNNSSTEPDDVHARQRAAISAFRQTMAKSQRSGQCSYAYFENETHLSVPLVGIYAGLLCVCEDKRQ